MVKGAGNSFGTTAGNCRLLTLGTSMDKGDYRGLITTRGRIYTVDYRKLKPPLCMPPRHDTNVPGFGDGRTPLYVHERVLNKLALVNGPQIGIGEGHPSQRHATFRELVNGLDEQEKPCFVIMPMKCTDKTNKEAEMAMLEALRPPLDTTTKGDGVMVVSCMQCGPARLW